MTDEKELYQKFSELRGQFGRYHSQIRKARRFYNQQFEGEVLSAGARARGFKAVVPRTARRSVDEAADHILFHPKIHVPVRPTDSDLVTQQEIAEKKRKAVTAWWRQITQRYNPLGDGRKWLFLDGKVAVRHTLRWELIPDADDPDYRRKLRNLGRNEFLWEHKLLNNEWVYEDPGDHRNPGYVFVAYSLLAEQAKKKFPGTAGAVGAEWRTRPDYSKVNYLEYWSAPEWHDDGTWTPGAYVQWIDTEIVHSDINPYPYVPIAVEDSGYGLNYEGIDIEDKFVGLLDHSYSVLVAQARQWTSMEAVAEMTAFNPIEARNMSDEEINALEVGPGAIWQLDGNPAVDPEAQSVVLTKWPDIPLTVMQMIQLTDREVNGALKTDALGGMPQRGVDTASEADQNVRNASAKLSNPVEALERLAAKLTRWMLMDIELVLEAPVTLFGTGPDDPADVTLTPREIGGYYDCSVELRTSDEEALDATRAKLWADLYQILPFLSAWTAMERGGISDDPLAEMLRRAGEDVFLSDSFKQIREATGAQSFGALMEYIAALQQQKPGAGGSQAPGLDDSAAIITPQELEQPPAQGQITEEAYDARNVNQADQAFAGGGA